MGPYRAFGVRGGAFLAKRHTCNPRLGNSQWDLLSL